MNESTRYSDVCRLCLSKRGKSLCIFDDGDNEGHTLISKIRACVDVEVLQDDDLPKQICSRCHCQINLFSFFKEDCATSQRKLKSWQDQLARSLEGSSEVTEVIHIKEEPLDDLSENFRSGDLEELTSISSESPEALDDKDGEVEEEEEGAEDEEDEEENQNLGNGMNLIIMDTTSIPADPMVCQEDIGPTVIELLPEDEDLLRTVVESEDDPRNMQDDDDNGNESDVIIIEPNKSSKRMNVMEVTLTDSPSQPDNEEDVEEEEMEDIPLTVNPFAPGCFAQDPCSVMLTRVKDEPNDTNPWVQPQGTQATSTSTVKSSADRSKPKKIVVKCPQCPRIFDSTMKKNMHMAKSHKKKEEGVSTISAPSPSIGLPKISNAFYDEETLTCKLCSKAYGQNLWRHMMVMHADRKPYSCPACRRNYTCKRDLSNHMVRALSKNCRVGKPPAYDNNKIFTENFNVPVNEYGRFICKECNAFFKTSYAVKTHFLLHTGEKPYECCKCGSEFRHYKNVSVHFKACKAPLPTFKPIKTAAPSKISPGEPNRVFKCDNCLKTLGSSSALWKHRKIDCKKRHLCSSCNEIIEFADWEAHVVNCNGSKRKKVAMIPSLTMEDILDIHKDKQGRFGRGLKCKLCLSTFSNNNSLRTHILKHTGKTTQNAVKQLRCNICNLTMQLESTLKSHMESYHGSPSQSTSNVATKARSALVAKHKARLAGFAAPKQKCDHCHALFSTLAALISHKRVHMKNRTDNNTKAVVQRSGPTVTANKLSNKTLVMCHVCKKTFHSRKILWQHKKVHSNHLKMKICKCTECGDLYSSPKALQAHKMSAHQGEERTATSSTSNSKIRRSASPSSTASVSDSKENIIVEQRHGCGTCGKFFSSESSLEKHKKLHRKVHESSLDLKSKPYCIECDKLFDSYQGFLSHKGWHSRIKKPQSFKKPKLSVGCRVCKKIFLNKESLKKHMVSDHSTSGGASSTSPNVSSTTPQATMTTDSDQMEHKCKICSAVFADYRSLNKHLYKHQAKTDGSIPVKTRTSLTCEICKKTLRSQKGYLKHMTNHTSQKPFKCELCSNQYLSESALTLHKELHGSQEFKPFACNQCKACFLEKDELLTHYNNCKVSTTLHREK